jgi:hypothetical protein
MTSPITLQKGGTVVILRKTAFREVRADGSKGAPIWTVELNTHERHPEWDGLRTTCSENKAFTIKREYISLGYKVMPNGPLRINSLSPVGPAGSLHTLAAEEKK